MPRDRAASDSRYFHEDVYPQDPQRERSTRRRHRHRDYDEEESSEARRERRERRRADDARRQAELDIDELRARRESYYSRPDSERRRESQRMAQDIRVDREKVAPRSTHKEVRRDGTRPRRRTTANDDDRSEDYVYGRPQSRGAVEPVTVRRSSTIRRSDEGGSSRTGYSPHSGSRSASLRKVETPKLSRSTSTRDPRDPSKAYMSTRPTLRRTSTLKVPTATASPIRVRSSSVREPPQSPQRRSTGGLLATLFKPPIRVPTMVVKEPARVDCLVCMNDDLPVHKTAKLGCGHRMCHSCIKRQFTLSVHDPQHMPPRCCSAEHIPLKYVERLFDDKFKKLWNKKYQEYTTGNRLYCPRKGCGEWIKPGKVRMDLTSGMKYARCSRCQTKVCVLCNSKFHTRRECPNDEETNRLVEMAKDQGWQRCYSCKAVVELKEGCNHMTCRCTAQFCMVCAAPWKTCNCPWFNYNHIDDSDRLNDMRVPYIPREEVVEVIEMPLEHSIPPVRRSSTRTRPRGQDRDLQRADEALAAHLQAQLRVSQTPNVPEPRRRDPDVQVYGLGNSGTHHMNESYTVRPLATAAARTAARVTTPTPRFFSRRLVPTQETATAQGPLRVPPGSVRAPPPRPAAPVRPAAPTVSSSTMAGLSLSGRKVGANRVGTWLNHVQLDAEAIATAPRYVDVDDWRVDGSMIGID